MKLASMGTAALVAAGALTTVAHASETSPDPISVQLAVEGKTSIVETTSDTVEELLEEQTIEVDPQDLISPPLQSELENDDSVTVVLAKKIRLSDGVKKTRTYTVAAVTVGDALQELNVKLRKLDRVRPGLTKRIVENGLIDVDRIKHKRKVKKTTVKFKTRTKKTAKLYRGVKRVKQAGKRGMRKTVYSRKFVDGKLSSRKKIKTSLVKKPRTKVVLMGTKRKPTLSGVWLALARCESGVNPRIVSRNGLYHGLFQFSVGTWRSVGGSGLPSRASVGEQLKRAKILQARSGWGQWPHCSRVIGVR